MLEIQKNEMPFESLILDESLLIALYSGVRPTGTP